MKERPILFSGAMVRALLDGSKTQTRRIVKHQPPIPNERWMYNGSWVYNCPYGLPGDLLWVRETWNRTNPGGETGVYYFRADTHFSGEVGRRPYTGEEQWRPSIHMPRLASRITLEVTGIRVERLQDISEADAIAEGVKLQSNGWWSAAQDQYGSTARAGYGLLWNSINGPCIMGCKPMGMGSQLLQVAMKRDLIQQDPAPMLTGQQARQEGRGGEHG